MKFGPLMLGRHARGWGAMALWLLLAHRVLAQPSLATQGAEFGGPLNSLPGNSLPESAAAASVPSPSAVPPLPLPSPAALVAEVRVLGNQHVPLREISPNIKVRAGRVFDMRLVEDDVRRLNQMRRFVSVDAQLEHTPRGVVVLYRVVERPTLRYVKFYGATVRRRTLANKAELKVGDPADPYSVEDARRKLEEFYHSKGYSKARVTILEGDQPQDQGAVFLISEGQKQRVFRVQFEGNTIASDGRLRTQIQSKPPFLYLFKGEVDREKIEGDVDRLTAYYRSLGFFRARIGRELEFNERQNWLTLRFIIDEGPRYKVRNVVFSGNRRFSNEELAADLKLRPGQYFDQLSMDEDVRNFQDRYGELGYIYADIQPDPRFLEEPGTLDLVYHVHEGARYRVGRIEVRIQGENPHTRRNTVLNRISLHPGDICNTRELRASERRLKASGLFLVDPAQGVEPRIVFKDPRSVGKESSTAHSAPPGFRGQSPDDVPGELTLVIDVALAGPPHDEPLQDRWRPYLHRTQVLPLEPVLIRSQSPDDSWSSQNQPPGDPRALPDSAWRAYQSRQSATGHVPLARKDPTDVGASGPPVSPRNAGPALQAAPTAAPQPADDASVWQGNRAAAPNRSPARPASQPGQPLLPPQRPGSGAGARAAYAPPSSPAAPAAAPAPGPQAPAGGGLSGTPALPPPQGYQDPEELFPENGYPFLQPEGEPTQPIDLEAIVEETQTGRIMFGVGVNSNAGLVGNIVLDEQNFDWRRWPRSWEDIRNGTAFRGAGQQFRIEATPGSQVSRYLFSFREPYLFDTRVGFGITGFFFKRFFPAWDEERLGGRVSLGYQFRPDLSGNIALRMENVNIINPAVPTPSELARVLGNSGLYTARVNLAYDTRDSAFLATEGTYLDLGYEQAFGDFDYPRFSLEARQYFIVRQRVDRSGRHVLSLGMDVGISGRDTPIFENYFAGGYSTLRGFRFRGAAPRELGIAIGGRFQFINSVEYMFPITADDALRAVVFCDFGTVERSVAIRDENFRVSPGLGLRISIPALGPAPIALDFAIPVARAAGDEIQNFSFFIGVSR
ncbi:MAG: BamA/TamA family outer membrane protein [Pirellulales bacterium]|nr:BamA/TamA family outer membrane protein [Pirellulales bacterium]